MEYFETTLKINDKRNEIDEMRDALTSIADEILKFEESEKFIFPTPKTFTENKNKFTDVLCHCKSKFKSKKPLLSKLRKDLRGACWVVKTLEYVKKKEKTLLTNQLVYARSECVDLLKKYNNNIDTIGNLFKQNESLHSKLANLENFIHLGYKELTKIQTTEGIEEPTTLVQLKKLIQSCGQYYADYRNENELCLKIKQRNRFLKNKIAILENNIEAIKEQLKALGYRNLRLSTENSQIKDKNVRPEYLNIKFAYSEVKMKQSIEEDNDPTNGKDFQDSGDSLQGRDFHLTTHLDIVNQLLSDQDTLLEDLTILTKEMSLF